MKGLLLALLLLGLAVVAADRVSVLLAERAVASQLADTGVSSAAVEIRGVPFLTQAVRGRYDEVFVEATDVPAGEVTLAQLDATLLGVHVPLSDALSGNVSAVPVDGVRATIVVPYTELDRRAKAAEVSVEPMGDRLDITGTVDVLGRTLTASTESTVELAGGEIIVTAETLDVGSGVVNAVLTKALRGIFDFRVSLEQLPYDMVPSGLDVTERGIVLDAFASDTVLTRP
jgi:hypothetical protein